jgi:hypothetical protein
MHPRTTKIRGWRISFFIQGEGKKRPAPYKDRTSIGKVFVQRLKVVRAKRPVGFDATLGMYVGVRLRLEGVSVIYRR